MKHLWAPRRKEYIKSDKSNECIFCTHPASNNDEKNYILFKGTHSFVIMNTFPYNCAHLMVSPYRHINCITKQNETERNENIELTHECIKILRTVIEPDGFNTGYNIGKAAGAGYDEHIHCHIVPRWEGDTNFMPVLGDVKVHPEHIRSTYEKLHPHFKKL